MLRRQEFNPWAAVMLNCCRDQTWLNLGDFALTWVTQVTLHPAGQVNPCDILTSLPAECHKQQTIHKQNRRGNDLRTSLSWGRVFFPKKQPQAGLLKPYQYVGWSFKHEIKLSI